jgi:hypothetical protein
MHLIGRWEKTRMVWTDGRYTPPYLLDRKWNRLLPYECDEWHRTNAGVWVPAIRGGAFLGSRQGFAPTFGLFGLQVFSQSTLALDSAYTYNTAGDAIGLRVMGWPIASDALAFVYFFITGFTGTAANVDDINLEVRNGISATSSVRPGTTSNATGSVNPASTTGWTRVTPTAFTPTQGTEVWFVIADADGGAIDFATVLAGITESAAAAINYRSADRLLRQGATHATGFSTAMTVLTGTSGIIVELASGAVLGLSYTDDLASTSNTLRRGLRMSDGVTEEFKLLGVTFETSTAWTTLTGVEVYAAATAPGGTTLASTTTASMASTSAVNAGTGYVFTTPYVVPKATDIRLVFTYGLAATTPRKMNIGTANGFSTPLRKARVGGSGWFWTEDNNAGGWTDDQDAQPHMGFLVEDQVAVASGGGQRFFGG